MRAPRDAVLHETRRSFRSGMVVTGLLVAISIGVLYASGLETWRLIVAALAFGAALTCQWIVIFRLGRDRDRRAAHAIDELRGERVHEALAQARRLQSVGAKVAHELKNPLAAIKGLVQLLERSAADDRTRERLGVMESEVERMGIILSEYLSFSRPLEDLHPAPLDLGGLVTDVVAVLSARAETGGVQLETSGEAPIVQADRRRLKEALINLVSNAIEATPLGGRVDVVLGPDAGGGATLEVRDTGRGIAPGDMTRLGQSYFTTREGGTGLGFVLAKGAVEQHGGKIEVSSRVGAGTTIRVTLPVAQEGRADG
jgi:signal transduction histidine kinase